MQAFRRIGASQCTTQIRGPCNLMQSDPEVIPAIRALFGDNAYIHGSLNRPYIAQLVFHQPDLRERLNHIVHPAVAKDFDQWAEKQPGHYVIEEAAILFESGAYRNMDAVVTVSTPEAQRIQRTCLRDHTDEASVRQRIAAQMSEEERIARAITSLSPMTGLPSFRRS